MSAFQISLRCCRFNQKSAVLPKTVASINAVSAVMARRLVHSSLTVFRLTPIASASCPWVSPIGTRNSSVIISPTLTGCRFVIFIVCLTYLNLKHCNVLFWLKTYVFLSKDIWSKHTVTAPAKSSEFVPATGSVIDNSRHAHYPVPHQNEKRRTPSWKTNCIEIPPPNATRGILCIVALAAFVHQSAADTPAPETGASRYNEKMRQQINADLIRKNNLGSRLYPHRVNTLGKMQEVTDRGIRAFETDVFFRRKAAFLKSGTMMRKR